MSLAAAFRAELTKLAAVPGAPSPAAPAGPGRLRAGLNRFGRRAAALTAVAVPVAAATYGLGRGLKRGERDKEQAAHADAVRAARLSGSPVY